MSGVGIHFVPSSFIFIMYIYDPNFKPGSLLFNFLDSFHVSRLHILLSQKTSSWTELTALPFIAPQSVTPFFSDPYQRGIQVFPPRSPVVVSFAWRPMNRQQGFYERVTCLVTMCNMCNVYLRLHIFSSVLASNHKVTSSLLSQWIRSIRGTHLSCTTC